MREFRSILRGVRKLRDWMVDEAVRREPSLELKFPDLWENTGNLCE
jgi:hypothetical protein